MTKEETLSTSVQSDQITELHAKMPYSESLTGGYATRIRSPMTPKDPLRPMAELVLTRPSEGA